MSNEIIYSSLGYTTEQIKKAIADSLNIEKVIREKAYNFVKLDSYEDLEMAVQSNTIYMVNTDAYAYLVLVIVNNNNATQIAIFSDGSIKSRTGKILTNMEDPTDIIFSPDSEFTSIFQNYYTKEQIDDFISHESVKTELNNHIQNAENPHRVTAEQVGAYTKDEVDNEIDVAIANLVNSSPEALDTLQELAEALGNDPDFATTVLDLIGNKADNNHTHELAGTPETYDVSLKDVATTDVQWIEIGEKAITCITSSGTATINVRGEVDIEFDSDTLVQVFVDGVVVYDIDFSTMTQKIGNTYYKGAVNDKIEVSFFSTGTFTFTKFTNTILKDGLMSGNQSKKLDETEIFTAEEKETVARVGAVEDASLTLIPFNFVELKEQGKLIVSEETEVTCNSRVTSLKGGTEAILNVNSYVELSIRSNYSKIYVDGVLLVDRNYKGYVDVITFADDISLDVQFVTANSHIGVYNGGYMTGEQVKDVEKAKADIEALKANVGNIGAVFDEVHEYAQTLIGGDEE